MTGKTFKVVARGQSAAIFRPNERIEIERFPSTLGPVDVRVTSRWLELGERTKLPGDLWIEVSGSGPSLSEVIGPFASAGAAVLPMISLVTNATVHEPEIELAFETTAGVECREYFQSFVAPESRLATVSRFIRPKAVLGLFDAIQGHAELKRVIRGINQYRIALEHWKMGRESQCVGHLWMASEAITKSVLRRECKRRGLVDERDLAVALGVELKALDSTVRRDLIFQSDLDAYGKAKKISDGFEHGFLEYREMNVLAKQVRAKAADFIRKCILDLCQLPAELVLEITKDGTHKPLGYWPVAKYIRGTLVGSGEELAPQANAYPFLNWKTSIKESFIDDDGDLKFTPSETITPEFADGISITNLSIEMWRPD